MERRVLRDPEADQRLPLDGYVTVPRFGFGGYDALRSNNVALRASDQSGFVSDLILNDRDTGRRETPPSDEALEGPATDLFVDFEAYLRVFLCRHPGTNSTMQLHRDWTHVDERLDGMRTYLVWVALEKVAGDNGRTEVVPGSHRLGPRVRDADLIALWLAHKDVIANASYPSRAGGGVPGDGQPTGPPVGAQPHRGPCRSRGW